jgi:hypothetical protein
LATEDERNLVSITWRPARPDGPGKRLHTAQDLMQAVNPPRSAPGARY